MSVLSTLALLMLPAALKPKRDDPEQEDLKQALADRDDQIAELKELINKLADDRDMWRNRALEAAEPRVVHHDVRDLQLAQYLQRLSHELQAQSANGQMNAQMAMQHQAQAMQNALIYGQGAMLGAQQVNAFNSQFDGFCNCVPSRQQVWQAHGHGDG